MQVGVGEATVLSAVQKSRLRSVLAVLRSHDSGGCLI